MVGAWIGLVALLAQTEPGDAAPFRVAPQLELVREGDLVEGAVSVYAIGESRIALAPPGPGQPGVSVYIRWSDDGTFRLIHTHADVELCARHPFFLGDGGYELVDPRAGGVRTVGDDPSVPVHALWPSRSCAEGALGIEDGGSGRRFVGGANEIRRIQREAPGSVVVARGIAARRIFALSSAPETLLVHTADDRTMVRIEGEARTTLLGGAPFADVVALDEDLFFTLDDDGVLSIVHARGRSVLACGVPLTAMLAVTGAADRQLVIADMPMLGAGDLWLLRPAPGVASSYVPLEDTLACPEPDAQAAGARPDLVYEDDGALDPTESATTTVLAHPVDPHDAETRGAALAAKTLAAKSFAFCHEVGEQDARTLRAFCGAWTPEARAICPAAAAVCAPPPPRWWDVLALPPAVGWAILAAIVAAALAVLFKLLRNAARDQAIALDALDAESLRAPVAALPDAPARALLAEARARLAAGDVDAAALLAHLAVLRALDDADVVRFHPSRTNREYLRLLRRRPEVRDVLAAVAREVEEIRFGRGHADAAHVPALLEAVEAALPRVRAPVPPPDAATAS
jgi:hypothetical protein